MNTTSRKPLTPLLLLSVFLVVAGSWSWEEHCEKIRHRASSEQAKAAAVLSPDQMAVFLDEMALQRDQEAIVQRSMAAAKQQLGDFNSSSWSFP
jgi:hypothetical protein